MVVVAVEIRPDLESSVGEGFCCFADVSFGSAHHLDPGVGEGVDCTTADAYATAFMVMGLDKAKAFCEKHPELNAYFICDGEGDNYEIFYTPGMEKFMVKR